jgi:hypothetical protein
MTTDNPIEQPGVSQAQEPTDGDRRTQAVNLFEMGSVLNETKGFLRGLEVGFTPRSG